MRAPNSLVILGLAAGLLASRSTAAVADDSVGGPAEIAAAGAGTEGAEFDISWQLHAAFVAAGSLGWILTETTLKDDLAPDGCRICGGNRLDDAVRDGLVWDNTGRADRLSDWLGFWAAPASALGLSALVAHHDGRLADAPIDALIVLDAMAFAAVLNQTTKFIAGRRRPFVRFGGDAIESDPDDNLSFYSGHTSHAFTLAVASGTVATLRGYRWAKWVWAVGLPIAAATGYLRIAADKHYATDVITGAVFGSMIGAGVPLLLGRRSDNREDASNGLDGGAMSVGQLPGGLALSYGFVW